MELSEVRKLLEQQFGSLEKENPLINWSAIQSIVVDGFIGDLAQHHKNELELDVIPEPSLIAWGNPDSLDLVAFQTVYGETAGRLVRLVRRPSREVALSTQVLCWLFSHPHEELTIDQICQRMGMTHRGNRDQVKGVLSKLVDLYCHLLDRRYGTESPYRKTPYYQVTVSLVEWRDPSTLPTE